MTANGSLRAPRLRALPSRVRANTARPGTQGRHDGPQPATILRCASRCAGSRLSFRSRKGARRTRPGHESAAAPSTSWLHRNQVPSRQATLEPLPDLVLRQLAADEDEAALALLAGLPRPLVIAVENHVHALEHEALVVILEGEDALAAQNARPLLLHQVLHPGEELVRVERLVGPDRDRLHLFVVIVFQAATIVVMMSVIVVVTMIMVMVMIVRVSVPVALQELGLDLQDAVEVERVAAEDLGQRDPATLGPVHLGIRVDPADSRLHLAQFIGRDQIGLVEQDDVGERDLVLGLRRILEPLQQPFGIGDRHHGVKLGLAADVLVHEEGLRDRGGIGEPGGLDDDGVELALAPHQPVDDAHEVAAHGAADAAVVHLEHFLVGPDDEVVVDADLAEFVDDDGVLLTVRLGQNAVEQGGLAGAEIAGQHGDGNLVGHRLTPFRHRIYASAAGCYHRRRARKTPRIAPRRARCDEARMLLNLTHIGQIALPVSNVDRSEAFYRDVLGLPKQYRFGDLTFFDCAGVRLLLEKSEGSITPQGCIYFRCADIALTVGELTRRGVTFTHKPRLIAKMDDHDLWMAFFADPDGHTLAVMQEAPKGYAPPPP